MSLWDKMIRFGDGGPVPGHRVGARVQWKDRSGGDWHDGTVIETARAYAVRVRWDDRHPDDRDGWHALGHDVEYLAGT